MAPHPASARPARPSPAPAGPPWPGDRGGHVWPKDREAVTEDGARIRYTVLGGGEGPPIVLCAGFMCPDNFWEHVAPALAERHPVVVLNYRGIGASTHPRDPGYRARNLRPEDYTIERFAGDVAAVLDAEGMTGAVAIGHSMGCQVALQLWRSRRDLVAGLVLVTGPYASPLHTFYGSKLGVYLFPFAYFGVPFLPRPVQRQVLKALKLPIAMPVARLVRALGPDTPDEGMDLYFDHFSRADALVVLKIARGMHEFDAGPWLHEVDVPVQVLVGSIDTFSPPAIGDALLASLPDGELRTIEDGTHGALIEFPDEIHDAIADFLHHRFDAPPATPRGRPGRVSAPRRRPEVHRVP
jgi:pimeloyl-ACP methyl ester carboxylesterase